VSGIEVYGLDISDYAINNSKEEVKNSLKVGNATNLPYKDNEFDFVYSINTLHNLYTYEL
jgi:protein-L-isoaspartate(D-aspartate) O-methyltransferase